MAEVKAKQVSLPPGQYSRQRDSQQTSSTAGRSVTDLGATVITRKSAAFFQRIKKPNNPTSNCTEVPKLTIVYTFDTENAGTKWKVREEIDC